MRRKTLFFFICIAILFLLLSCDDKEMRSGKNILVSVALDYRSHLNSKLYLKNTINDQGAAIMQFEMIYKNLEVHMFREEQGVYYYSEDPEFIKATDGAKSYQKYVERKSGGQNQIKWTSEDILSLIKGISTDKNDLLIFYYSGHGDGRNGKLYFNANDSIELESLLSSFQGPNKKGTALLLLDSCNSGRAIKNQNLSNYNSYTYGTNDRLENYQTYNGTSFFESFDKEFTLLFNQKETNDTKIYIMAACGPRQNSLDGQSALNMPHSMDYGAFTYHLLYNLGYNMELDVPDTPPKKMSLYELQGRIISEFPKNILEKQTPETTLTSMDLELIP